MTAVPGYRRQLAHPAPRGTRRIPRAAALRVSASGSVHPTAQHPVPGRSPPDPRREIIRVHQNKQNYTIIQYRSRVTSRVTRKHPDPCASRPPLAPPTPRHGHSHRGESCTSTPTSPSNYPTAIQGVPPIGWVACSVTNLCASNCAAAWWYSR